MRERVGAALHADDDIVGEADHQRVVGGLEHAGLGRLAGRRRLGGGHPPLELAHRLLDQLEGLLHRAVERRRCAGPDRPSAAPSANALAGIGGRRWLARRAAWRAPRSAAGVATVGGHVVDARQIEEGRHVGERPGQQQQAAAGRRPPRCRPRHSPCARSGRARRARSAPPGRLPATPTANRLTATRVGNEVSRCSTTPTSSRLAENSAIRLDQRASGATIIVDRSIMAFLWLGRKTSAHIRLRAVSPAPARRARTASPAGVRGIVAATMRRNLGRKSSRPASPAGAPVGARRAGAYRVMELGRVPDCLR